MDKLTVTVPFVSVWDGGTEVETTATVNLKTGEVTDIVVINTKGFDVCERQYIILNDEQVDVYDNEPGYKYWADIKGIHYENYASMKKFVVSFTEINYGFAIIDAESAGAAVEMARDVYNAGNVHWTNSEISEISAAENK